MHGPLAKRAKFRSRTVLALSGDEAAEETDEAVESSARAQLLAQFVNTGTGSRDAGATWLFGSGSRAAWSPESGGSGENGIATSIDSGTIAQSLSDELQRIGISEEDVPDTLGEIGLEIEEQARDAKLLGAGAEYAARRSTAWIQAICDEDELSARQKIEKIIVQSHHLAVEERNERVRQAKSSLTRDDEAFRSMVKMCTSCTRKRPLRAFAPNPLMQRGLYAEFVNLYQACEKVNAPENYRASDFLALHSLAVQTCGECRVIAREAKDFSKKRIFYRTVVDTIKRYIPCEGCVDSPRYQEGGHENTDGADYLATTRDTPAFVYDVDHGREGRIKNFNVSRFEAWSIDDLIKELLVVFKDNPGGGCPCAFHHRLVTRADIDANGVTDDLKMMRRNISFLVKLQMNDGKCAVDSCGAQITADTSCGFDFAHLEEDTKATTLHEVLDHVMCALRRVGLETLTSVEVAKIITDFWPELRNARLLCANHHRIETMEKQLQKTLEWEDYVEDATGESIYDIEFYGRRNKDIVTVMKIRLAEFVSNYLDECADQEVPTKRIDRLLEDLREWVKSSYDFYLGPTCVYSDSCGKVCGRDLKIPHQAIWGGNRFATNFCRYHFLVDAFKNIDADETRHCALCPATKSCFWWGFAMTNGPILCISCYRKQRETELTGCGVKCANCGSQSTTRWYRNKHGNKDDTKFEDMYWCAACFDRLLNDEKNRDDDRRCFWCNAPTSTQRWYVAKTRTEKLKITDETDIQGEYECYDCRERQRYNDIEECKCADCGIKTLTHPLIWRHSEDQNKMLQMLCSSCFGKRYRTSVQSKPFLKCELRYEGLCKDTFQQGKHGCGGKQSLTKPACGPCNVRKSFLQTSDRCDPTCTDCERKADELLLDAAKSDRKCLRWHGEKKGEWLCHECLRRRARTLV